MKYILCISLLVFGIVFIPPTKEYYVRAEFLPSSLPPPLTVKEMIYEIAPKFKQDSNLIDKIIYCESGYIPVSHDGNRGYGVTGIHKTTWNLWLIDYEKEQGETLDYQSSYDQIKMISWAFSKGSSYKNQWTTYVAYMNGGSYTFYSKTLKGTYTAKCL